MKPPYFAAKQYVRGKKAPARPCISVFSSLCSRDVPSIYVVPSTLGRHENSCCPEALRHAGGARDNCPKEWHQRTGLQAGGVVGGTANVGRAGGDERAPENSHSRGKALNSRRAPSVMVFHMPSFVSSPAYI